MRGNVITFEAFLDAELDRLRRYAQVLTGNRDDAHDLLTDTLIKAQLAWAKIAAVDQPAAYVRRMLTNAHISQQRRWGVRMIRAVRPEHLPELPVADHADSVDALDELRDLLRQLPPQQRAAITLRYLLRLPDVEIASELHCSTTTVRSYVSKGLAALRISLTYDADTNLQKEQS